MEIFLVLNGLEISADIDEQERAQILGVASGELNRSQFTRWLTSEGESSLTPPPPKKLQS